mgnify:CR=1 FL=1
MVAVVSVLLVVRVVAVVKVVGVVKVKVVVSVVDRVVVVSVVIVGEHVMDVVLVVVCSPVVVQGEVQHSSSCIEEHRSDKTEDAAPKGVPLSNSQPTPE